MSFSLTTFLFQLVNVLVLLAVLQRLLFRPVAEIIAKRQAATDAALRAAEAAKAEAEAARKQADAASAATEAARHDVLAAAQAQAEAQAQQIIAAAQARADAARSQAEAQARHTVAAASEETLARARDLAQAIARKALSELPDPPTAAAYAERLAQALAALPEDRRRVLLAGGNLRLAAPHPLAAEERAGALRRLGIAAAGVEEDPALILGLDLRSDSGIVHNSLAHDLDRIATALKPEAAA
jgi:F-type H+-transporting ATPase subunit b